MSILLLSSVFPPQTGGSARWFWEIYRRLPREEVVIAAGEDPRQDEFDRTHDRRVVRSPLRPPDLGILSVGGSRGYWRALQAVRRLVRSEGVRQVHCGCWVPEGWIAWLLKRLDGLPYTCYAHGEEVNLVARDGVTGVLSSRQLRWMARRVLHGADLVIANSRNTERMLREGWGLPEERVRVLYPGVDTRRFVPAPRDAAVRADLGWGDRPVVLTVGRLQKRKGHDQMIRALAAICRAIPNILYAIAGDGEERAGLEALVAQEGVGEAVQFLGEPDDEALVRCYQQCDLFVLANRQVGSDLEGFGMVLLEAQACGRPVVAGASGGTAEAVAPGAGRLVRCDGPEELAAVVADLLSDQTRLDRLGAEARARVVERFDWESLFRQAETLFGTVRAPRPSPVPEPVSR